MYRIVFKAEDIIDTEGSASHFDPLFLKLKERQKYIQGLIANIKIVIFRFVNFPFLFQYFSFSCICALRSQLLEHVSIIEVVKLPKTKYLTNILNNIV